MCALLEISGPIVKFKTTLFGRVYLFRSILQGIWASCYIASEWDMQSLILMYYSLLASSNPPPVSEIEAF